MSDRMAVKGTIRRWQAAVAALATLAALAWSAPASAALYGYVDENGDAHFANEKLDDRYRLFVREGKTLNSLNSVARPGATAAQASADPGQTKLFRALLNHPNIPKVEPLIQQAASAHDVDPALVKAVMAVESGFNAGAVSDKGAIGLMQVIPDTGARFGVSGDARRTVEQKLADPRTNISAGVRYLSFLSRMFPGQLELVLAAYNAGEGAVQKYNNRIPPYPETQQYVQTVMQFYRMFQPSGGMMLADGNPRTMAAAGPKRVRMVIGGRASMP